VVDIFADVNGKILWNSAGKRRPREHWHHFFAKRQVRDSPRPPGSAQRAARR